MKEKDDKVRIETPDAKSGNYGRSIKHFPKHGSNIGQFNNMKDKKVESPDVPKELEISQMIQWCENDNDFCMKALDQNKMGPVSIAVTEERIRGNSNTIKYLESISKKISELYSERDETAYNFVYLNEKLLKAEAERDKLKEFKEYVHKRLDDAGIPVDPESEHKAKGCRIGGRLDVTFNRMVKLESDLERLREENERFRNYLFQQVEYLKSTNVFHKNQGEINAIEKLLRTNTKAV